MKLNRKLVLVLALVLSLALATGSTLAYLTDRDSDANVFTLGNVDIDLNEDFEQGAELIPGKDIEKKPYIENTGKTDAWVWATVAIPAALDCATDASQNVVHFNYEDDYVNDTQWTWKNTAGQWLLTTEEHDGVEYNVYTVLYQSVLKPGEVTPEVINNVYMDYHIDIDPNGDLYHVENGVVTGPYWNFETDGNPVIHVSAYAMQAEGFDSVQKAYAAYTAQWTTANGTNNGIAWGDPANALPGDNEEVVYETPEGAFPVTSAAELAAAVADGKTVLLLAPGEYDITGCKGKELTLIGEDPAKTILTVVGAGQSEANGQLDYDFDSSDVTFMNLTIKTNNQTYAGYARLDGVYKNVTFENTYCLNGTSEFVNCTFNISGDQYNIWTWGAPTATFTNCTFNSDGKAVLLYGRANTVLTVDKCVFNDNGGLSAKKAAIEIGNDYNTSYQLIVNNTEVNGYEENDQGILTGSTLWANKNSMGSDKLNVVLDGVDIY